MAKRHLTHVDTKGRARMVDVTFKRPTPREAVAQGEVRMSPSALRLVVRGGLEKGDALALARAAGILAAKRVGDLIPLCHPLGLTYAGVEFHPRPSRGILRIEARVRTEGKTGVEMEALTAVSVAALTVYDMVKAVDTAMVIGAIRLVGKKGGKTGPPLIP